MKKRDKDRFRKSKRIICFALVQVGILLLFIGMFYQSKPIKQEDTRHILITVTDVAYERNFGEYKFYVFSDSDRYEFFETGAFSLYSNKELYEMIRTGDRISLIYVEKGGLFGKTNSVVDARTETETYRSLEQVNASFKKANIVIIVFFFIVELLYLAVLALCIAFHNKTKAFSKRKKGG